MRLHACLIGLGLVLRACTAAPLSAAESACCEAYAEEGSAMVLRDGRDGGMVPLVCHQQGVGCPLVGARAHVPLGPAFDKALDHQLGLRSLPECPKSEWGGRCPSGSTMLLANWRGGCVAAGCTPLGGAEALEGEEEEKGEGGGVEDATLRAVVAQEVDRLREATSGSPPTMYRHTSRLRAHFEKGQKALAKDVEAAMRGGSPDVQEVRHLLVRADVGGFVGANLDLARTVVDKHDREERALSILRRVPRIVMSEVARVVVGVAKEFGAKQRALTIVEHEVGQLQEQVSALKSRVGELGEAAVEAELTLRAEVAAKTAAAAAGDEARADVASCAKLLNGLDSASADLAASMPEAEDRKDAVASLPRVTAPDEELPPEAAYERACTRLSLARTTMQSFAAEMADGINTCQADLQGVRRDVSEGRALSSALERRIAAAEQHGADLEEELSLCDGKVSQLSITTNELEKAAAVDEQLISEGRVQLEAEIAAKTAAAAAGDERPACRSAGDRREILGEFAGESSGRRGARGRARRGAGLLPRVGREQRGRQHGRGWISGSVEPRPGTGVTWLVLHRCTVVAGLRCSSVRRKRAVASNLLSWLRRGCYRFVQALGACLYSVWMELQQLEPEICTKTCGLALCRPSVERLPTARSDETVRSKH